MKSWLCILVASAALTTPLLFGADEEATGAEVHFASLLAENIKDSLVSRLADSGVAPTDAAVTADTVILEYAKCTIPALRKNDNPTAVAFLGALDEGLSPEDMDTRLREVGDEYFAEFILELNAITEPCRIDIDSRFGIPPEN